jgi:hypothetical protein
MSQDLADQSQWLSSKSQQVKLDLLNQICVFFDEDNSMFCFFVGLEGVSDSRFFEHGFVPFHVKNFEVAEDDKGDMCLVNPIGKIQIFINEVYLFIKEDFFENARRRK